MHSDLTLPSLAADPASPTWDLFYSLGNRSAPILNSTSSLSICRDSFISQHGPAFILSQDTPSSIEPVPEWQGPAKALPAPPDDRKYRPSSSDASSLPVSLPSPVQSHACSDGMMSQSSGSTQFSRSTRDNMLTAPSSENRDSSWFAKSGRTRSASQSTFCSISQSDTDGQYTPLSETCPLLPYRTSAVAHSRYKMRSDPRFLNLHLRMTHLLHASNFPNTLP